MKKKTTAERSKAHEAELRALHKTMDIKRKEEKMKLEEKLKEQEHKLEEQL